MMTPIYILMCLALVGCEQEPKPEEYAKLAPFRSSDNIKYRYIEAKLVMIAEKLERIALALEKKQ